MTDRWTLYALAPARTPWFTVVSQWSTSGAIAADVTKCLSVDEMRGRLASGRPVSAVVIDGATPGIDRDLLDRAVAVGAAVLVVDGRRAEADWLAIGAGSVLVPGFTAADLLGALVAHAAPVASPTAVAPELRRSHTDWLAPLIAVCGPGGTGASVAAMALAQALAADLGAGTVVLADLALRGDQAMLHDCGDVVPGVQELVEAHRLGEVSSDDARALCYRVDAGYDVLLGLRQPRAWAALRPLAVEAAVLTLRRGYRVVVADIEPDFDGEDETGSIDVEERNTMARTAVTGATAVLVVGTPGVKGVHALGRTVNEVVAFGIEPERVVPVFNRAPRSPRARAELTAALAALTGGTPTWSPVFVPERNVEDALRSGRPIPAPMPQVLAGAVAAVSSEVTASRHELRGARVVPGSLGVSGELDEASG